MVLAALKQKMQQQKDKKLLQETQVPLEKMAQLQKAFEPATAKAVLEPTTTM